MKNLSALLGTVFFAGALVGLTQLSPEKKLVLPTYSAEIQSHLVLSDNSSKNEYNLPVEEVKSLQLPLLYNVQKGDTWSELAEEFGFPLEETMKKNGYDMNNASSLRTGEIINLN